MFRGNLRDIIRRKIQGFRSSVRGSIATTFALLAVPVCGIVGVAVDYSQASSVKTSMQSALDSTALAMVKSAASLSGDQLTTSAASYFNSVFKTRQAQNISITSSYDSSKGQLVVSGSATMPTTFAKLIGQSQVGISGVAKSALGGSQTWAVCVLITDPASNHTLLVKNLASIDFNNCMVQVNTANWDAVEARDSSYIHSVNGINCFTGDIHYGDVTPPKQPTCDMLADPYASFNVPTNPCTYTNMVVNTSTTLSPGTYCGGIKISGSTTATFSPGVYYIQAGDLQVLNSANVVANGVTFLLTGKSSNINLNTTGTITLTPCVDPAVAGQWAGFAFYWDQPSSKNGQTNIISGATVNAQGIFYFSGQALTIGKDANVTINTGSVIADFLLGDGGHLTLAGNANSQGLKKAIASTTPVLVQ